MRDAASVSRPRVTILLGTFNGSRYLPEQLASVERQHHSNWRLVAADDGSTDATADVLEDFRKRYPDRVEILHLPPSGSPAANFFRLLRGVDGASYVAFCDQDDVWDPRKLGTLVAACERLERDRGASTPCMVFSDLRVVGPTLTPIASSFFQQIAARPREISLGSTLVENAIPGCAMLVNAALVQEFQTYGGDLGKARMHDWWLGLIAHALGAVEYVPEALVDYRQHDANAAGSVRRRGLVFAIKKLRGDARVEVSANVAQAQVLLAAYGSRLGPLEAQQVTAFAGILSRSKARRILTCLRLGILKQGLARRTYQLVRI